MIKNTDFKLEEIYSPDNANVIYFAYKNKLESIRVLIGFSQGFLGDNIVSRSRAEELTRSNHLKKEELTQKEKETIEKILMTEQIKGKSIFNYCIDEALEVYQSKKDKTINCVKVCFSDNKISIKYYSHESADNIFVSDRIFNNKEIEQFRGWKTKYNDKI
jgi:hypothetical protein